MGASKWFFSMSGIILLVGALAIAGKGINFGIDFQGGTRLTAGLTKPATVDQIRSVLVAQGLGDAKVQTISNPQLGPHAVQISAHQLGKGGIDGVQRALDQRFGINGTPSAEEIGPSFGKSVAKSAVYAIIASLLVISAYIALRFEWKFAVPVLIALMHDVLIVAGVYALVGREVTTATVAALLTILGYSLYDTIIVFDRVRENIPRMPSAAFPQIVNRALSEVLTRSLATSFCTLLPVLSLLLFGGDTLKDFAFALLVGIASGTYSSVFIATPVLAHWKEREPVYRAREHRIRAELGEIPAYATAAQGHVDVAEPRGGRRAPSVTAPGDPTQVSRAEFDDMVANLGIEGERPTAAAAGPPRPAGGRRGRSRANGAPPPPATPRSPGEGQGSGSAPDPRERKPRNRRHGRPR
jgi:SecD/SecF fusion protein